MRTTLFLLLTVLGYVSFAQDQSFDEVMPATKVKAQVGEQLPVNLPFVNDLGELTRFSDLLDKPVILNYVYYRCPGICSPLLTGVVKLLNEIPLQPGNDFNVITLSFDETENFELAAGKKENYLKMMKRELPVSSWHWLSGESRDINALTSASGFEYLATGKDFIHPAAIFILSPDGRLIRFFEGVVFDKFDVEMALLEATPANQRSFSDNAKLWLYQYQDEGSTYALNQATVGSFFVLLALLVGLAIFRSVKHQNKQQITS